MRLILTSSDANRLSPRRRELQGSHGEVKKESVSQAHSFESISEHVCRPNSPSRCFDVLAECICNENQLADSAQLRTEAHTQSTNLRGRGEK